MSQLPAWIGCLGLGLGMIAGCGPSAPVREYADVEGKVTYKGEALKKGTILFQPASGAAVAAEIQPDGSYSLIGVIGQNTVMVDNREPDPGPGAADPEKRKAAMAEAAAVAAANAKAVPAKFGTPGSPLKFDVQPGLNAASFDIK